MAIRLSKRVKLKLKAPVEVFSRCPLCASSVIGVDEQALCSSQYCDWTSIEAYVEAEMSLRSFEAAAEKVGEPRHDLIAVEVA